MANIKGYTATDQKDLFDLHFDDGTSMPVPDPTGTFRKEVDDIVAKLNVAKPSTKGAVASTAGGADPFGVAPPPREVVDFIGMQDQARADQGVRGSHATPGLPSRQEDLSAMLDQPIAPPGGATGPVGGGATGPRRIVIPGTPGGTKTATSTSTTKVGYSPEDTAKLEATDERLYSSQQDADAATLEHQRGNAGRTELGALLDDANAQQDFAAAETRKLEVDRIIGETQAEKKVLSETKIDPSQAFGGDRIWFAALGQLGVALSQIGAAFLGQNNYDPVFSMQRMIDRSVEEQLRQKREKGELLDEKLADYKIEKATLTARAAAALAQHVGAQKAFAQSKEEFDALESTEAQMVAARDAALAARQEGRIQKVQTTQSVDRQSTPGTPDQVIEVDGNADDVNDELLARKFDQEADASDKGALAKLADHEAALGRQRNLLQKLKKYAGDGILDDVIGAWQYGKGVIPARWYKSPEQADAANALNEWRIVVNRMKVNAEPNSIEVQKQLGDLGVPTTDREVPLYLDNAMKALENDNSRLYSGYTDTVAAKHRVQSKRERRRAGRTSKGVEVY